MSEEFAPIKRKGHPEPHASGATGSAQVSVKLTAWPDSDWIQSFNRADKGQQGVRRSVDVRLNVQQPDHPGEIAHPTVSFTVESDDDFEAAVAEVDTIIDRSNQLYLTMVLPEREAQKAADATAEQAEQQRQAKLEERAKRLTPPA